MDKKKADSSPLSGFPSDRKFQTMAEIEAYFEGNSIQCLECGRHFRGLARHLREHGLTADQYKERHGIPWGRGLLCGQLHLVLSEAAKASDLVDQIGDKRGDPKKRGTMRGYAPARRAARMLYTESDYYRLAKRVSEGEPFLAVCKDPDMPSDEAVKAYRKFNPEYDAYWRMHVQPALMPIKGSARDRLANGDIVAIKAALAEGHSIADVAARFGYTWGMVQQIKMGKVYAYVSVEQNKPETATSEQIEKGLEHFPKPSR